MGTKLKHDRRTVKITKVLTIVFACLFAASIILDLLTGNKSVAEVPTGLIVIGSFIMLVSIPLLLISGYCWAESAVYVRRLEKNGFRVPYKKSECGEILENVPREGEAVTNLYACDSVIAVYITAAAFAISVLCDIIYISKWLKLGESDALAGFVFLLIFHLIIFVIPFVIFRRQRNTEFYADDVDIRGCKMARMAICKAIFLILLLSLLSAVAIIQVENMTKYIYKSRTGQYNETYDVVQPDVR